MKEPKDLTAEDFLKQELDGIDFGYFSSIGFLFQLKEILNSYAKYHVKQALIAIQELQTKKEVQGYPGTLTKEELEEIYPLDNIK